MQVKLPTVLLQTALSSQLWLLSLHSSTSECRNTCRYVKVSCIKRRKVRWSRGCEALKILPFVPKGVPTYLPLKTIFPVEFMRTIWTIDRGHQTLFSCEEKKIKCFTVQNSGHLKIFASRHCTIPQNLKNHFPNEFLDEMWIKLADYQ